MASRPLAVLVLDDLDVRQHDESLDQAGKNEKTPTEDPRPSVGVISPGTSSERVLILIHAPSARRFRADSTAAFIIAPTVRCLSASPGRWYSEQTIGVGVRL
jgi:hypothetical protein